MFQDKFDRNIEITTGDGVQYICLWNESTLTLDFANTVYEFINKPKSFVDKRNPKSKRIPMSIIFQGEKHIETANRFLKSAEDKRYWVVNHPVYGVLNGHPISIEVANNSLSVTQITIDFIETITDEAGVVEAQSSFENSSDLYNELSEDSAQAFSNSEDIGSSKKSILQSISDVSIKYKSIYTNDTIQEIQNNIRNISTYVDNIISAPYNFVKDLYNFVGYIAFIKTNIIGKIQTIEQIYEDFKNVLSTESSSKKYFESAGASAIGTTALSILNIEDSEVFSREDLVSLGKQVSNMYSDYFSTLEKNEIQLEENNSFIIDYKTQNNLYTLVASSIYKIMQLIYNARQERVITLDKDSNLIVLTHRYMGLDDLDKNIDSFRKMNNIKNKNIFIIKKGTKIRYYI